MGLGRDGVEDQGGLAGAGYTGEDGELALGDGQGDIAQVVFARAGDLDVFHGPNLGTTKPAAREAGGRCWEGLVLVAVTGVSRLLFLWFFHHGGLGG